MSGIVRVRCPKCKLWMSHGADLCRDCMVFLVRVPVNEEEE
jgi:hypothetical protein